MPIPSPLTRLSLRRFAAASFWITALTISINDYLLEITPITGRSMSPTISPDYHTTGATDTIAWRKHQPASADLRRGDIVLYHTPFRAEGSAVKRVIALGGDTVILDPRRRPGTDADGENLPGERTVAKNWDVMAPRVKVPYGHVWLEGDNWRASQDSNYFGPVSRSLIVGRAVGVVWPVGRWGRPWEGGWEGRSGTRVIRGREVVPLEWEELVGAGF